MARRKSRRQRRQSRQAYINFAIVAAILVGAAYFFTHMRPAPYDEASLCVISDELPPHTAIILDKTDEYTKVQSDLIAAIIRRTGDKLEVGERLTLFELDAKGRFDPRGRFSLCNPSRGAQVNPLFRNPEQIEERYLERFEAPLDDVLVDLIEPKEAPSSPILEAIARLAQTENFSRDAPSRKIVIVSDMLQNSDTFSAYGGSGGGLPETTPDAIDTADAILRKFGDNLRGTELEIRLIPRERHVDLQRGGLKDYWDEIFSELGVRVRWRDL